MTKLIFLPLVLAHVSHHELTTVTENDMRDYLRTLHSNYETKIQSSSRPQQNAVVKLLNMIQRLTGKHHSSLDPNPEPITEPEPEPNELRHTQIIDAHTHHDENGNYIPDNFHTSVEMMTAMIMFKAGKTDVIYNELDNSTDYHNLEYFVEKYSNYGCYCFHNIEGNAFFKDNLGGGAVDSTDEVCMKWYRCDKCTKLDPAFNSRGEKCDDQSFYHCSGSIVQEHDDEGNWYEVDRFVECTDPIGTCERSKCECDIFLVNEMAERIKTADSENDPYFSSSYSSYDIHAEGNCVKQPHLDGPKQCCGHYENANIMPYYPRYRQCCETSRLNEMEDNIYQVFDPVEKKCCSYGTGTETQTTLVPVDWLGTCDED